MEPYRTDPKPAATPAPRMRCVDSPEDLVLYSVLSVIGVIPLVLALARGARFGLEERICLVVLVIGLIGLCRVVWRFLHS